MDITLGLTHDCNLGCTYCYAGEKRRAAMSRETVEFALSLARRHTGPGKKVQLSFFGGEPLLEWDTLCWATERARDAAQEDGFVLQPTVTTNATLLTPERARWLADAGFAVGISIDGDRESHDATRRYRGGKSSFDAVLAGIHAALPLMPNLETILVVDPANVEGVERSTRFLAGEGVRCISLNPNFYTEWSDDQGKVWDREYTRVADFFVERFRAGEDLYINYIDGKIITRLKGGFACGDRCDFGEHEVAVAPSGRMYPCERLVGVDTGEVSIGHVATGFDEEQRQPLLSCRGNTNPECLTCAVKTRCVNWCGCINYATTGHIDRVAGDLCFHEQLCIREADRAAELLWSEQNPLFLRKYYHDTEV